MARRIRFSFLILMIASFALGWRADPVSPFYPVSMTLAGDRLFVSDLGNGVRVFDVADPAAPVEVETILLNGNQGSAVRDDILYANEYSDLVVLRAGADGYEEVARISTEYDWGSGGTVGFKGMVYDNGYGCVCGGGDFEADSAPRATGSSYATFAIIGDFLYRVDYSALVTYDITKPARPVEVARKEIGWEIETIHPTDDFLFIGGTRGMYIFDRADPAAPREIGRVEHVRACDPVVVSGPVAYVTLRGAGSCGGARDALLCVDITDPANPEVIVDQEIPSPFGLAVRAPYLFVSNGAAGFTLLDVERPQEPAVIASWSDRATRDFLWEGNVLYVVGELGIHVFDVSDPRNPVHLATVTPGPA